MSKPSILHAQGNVTEFHAIKLKTCTCPTPITSSLHQDVQMLLPNIHTYVCIYIYKAAFSKLIWNALSYIELNAACRCPNIYTRPIRVRIDSAFHRPCMQLCNSPKKSRKGRDVQKLQMYSIYPTHLCWSVVISLRMQIAFVRRGSNSHFIKGYQS